MRGDSGMGFNLRFRLVYDDKNDKNQVYAEYDVQKFEEVLLAEWTKIKNAGDRVEVIKRAYERACEAFKLNAVSISAEE